MPKSTSHSKADSQPNGKPEQKDAEGAGMPVGVVGLGASAGGVAVLQQFFENMPADTGLAFVVVMHLSPEHESSLPEILQRTTAMPVVQVTEEEKVQPNHVYVIPPNKHLTMADSTLRLSALQQAAGGRVAIDLFFRTLADAYGQRSVCVVLTGTASDGAIGLKHIKAQGGVTIAQDPAEAEHNSMPRSAIETGMVDWVLPVREMSAKLLEFVRNEKRMELPPEERAGGKDEEAPDGPTVARQTEDPADESALYEVLRHLRSQTNHDFSQYKRATVLRRIARRLQVNSLENIPEYLKFLRANAGEGRALLQDLLISVTHFFRDREAFAALEANIPQLFCGKTPNDQVRVWVPACATGEEAYSVAMLLCEQAAKLENPPSVQVFATDIDEESVAGARTGLYPSTIEVDVSQERLRQFFSRDHSRYRVKKEIRETVLFAPHDLLRDPPFSRLDLISCRNLLIYLKRATQAHVLGIFHFALRPSGLLFVGGSESVEDAQPLFAPIEKHHRIYVRRSAPRPAWMIPALPLSPTLRPLPESIIRRPSAMTAMSHPGIVMPQEEALPAADAQERRALLFGAVHLNLLEKYGPPSVVINDNHDVVHLSEHAGRYLQFGGGELSANLLALVHPALRIELRTAIFRARQDNRKISIANVAVEVESKTELLDVHVQPVDESDQANGFILIVFERKPGATPLDARPVAADEPLARHLEEELQQVKQQLSGTVEQYEASSEELKASNEELQAMNEEVRSTAEELETSKEELQSINEELTTVNQELKNNIERLSSANSDLQNLMAATDIGTIFLDRQLRIKRFTPSLQEIFNLLASDIGRPLSDITHKLEYAGMTADAGQVLEKLCTIDREVTAGGDLWFLTRIKPYRTTEDKIDGVVATFVDITARKRAELKLQELTRQLASQLKKFNTVMTAVPDFIYHFDLAGRFTYANQALLDLWGKMLEQAVGKNFDELEYPPELARKLQRQIDEVIATGRTLKDETPFTSVTLGERQYEYIFFPLFAPDGRVEAVAGTTRDITERKEAEQALAASEERFRQFAENSADALWIIDPQINQLEYVSPAYERIWGEPREEVLRELSHWQDLLHPDDRERVAEQLPRLLAGETRVQNYRIIRPSDGEIRWIRDTGFPVRDENGEIQRLAGVAQDITADKMHLEALASSEERFRLLVDGARDYAIFMLDPANRIIYWSAGAERIFGWSAEEALGQSGELVFTPEDRATEREETELEIAWREGCASDRRWHLRKDGTRIWVDGVMRRLVDENGEARAFAKIARDATEERLAEEKLQKSRAELEHRVQERTAELTATNRQLEEEIRQRTELEQELILISEREKRRIGQDLHDGLCQELAAAAFFLQSSAHTIEQKSPREAEVLARAASIVNANVGLARDLARGLHPVELGVSGLTNALRELASRTSHGPRQCLFECPKPIRVRDDSVALNLYRIAQEAVANAVKNGKAKKIVIRLARQKSRLVLTVKDDGAGFPSAKRTKGMGIHIMKYRANTIGGTLAVEARAGHGTTVTCILGRA